MYSRTMIDWLAMDLDLIAMYIKKIADLDRKWRCGCIIMVFHIIQLTVDQSVGSVFDPVLRCVS
jgi:hypothetical protein